MVGKNAVLNEAEICADGGIAVGVIIPPPTCHERNLALK